MSGLTTVIGDMLEDRLLDVHTALPGKIVSYQASQQLADVDILVPINGEKIPTLGKVPIAWPRTARSFIHLPLQPGDFVIVLVSEETIGTWRANRGVLAPTGDLRRHSLSGCWCLPCGYPDASAFHVADPTKVTIHCPNGILYEGDLRIEGALTVTGAITAGGEVTAQFGKPQAVKLSTHLHNTAMGPSSPPTPGT